MLNKILTKFGLGDSERRLIIKAALISTGVCAALIGLFWAFHAISVNPGLMEGQFFGKDAGIAAVGDLDIEAHEFTAIRHMQAGRPETAIPHLQRVAAARAGEQAGFNAQDRMVTAYLEMGEFERALGTINDLLPFADNALEMSLQVRRGIALYNLKRYEESSDALQKVLEREPENAQALCFMGQMEAAAQTRSPAAERFFRRAIAADPNYTEARYQFAKYFENNGDYQNAREFLLQVLEKDPLNVRAHARLGMIYYYEFNIEPALKSYQTALALNPYDYNTRYNLGELYRTHLEDNESALREFVAAIELNPRHSDAHYRAGLICAGNDMMKEAIRYFEACLQSDRQNIRRLLQLAAAYERIGDKATALSIYHEVTAIDPLHDVALHKIRFLEKEG